VIYRTEVRPFSDRQIALLRNFAAQGVIAIENARLITETREALEQQTATAEVLQVINASPGDLAPVFDAMLERATSLCEASFGALFIREGERTRAVATRGIPDSLNDFVRRGFVINPERNPIYRGEAITHVLDLTKEPLGDQPGCAAAVQLGGARTMLGVALRKDDILLGNFSVFRQEVRSFSDTQIALLQNFAAQAVIAMENARLLVHKAITLCDAASGTLWTCDGERFDPVAHRLEHWVEVARRRIDDLQHLRSCGLLLQGLAGLGPNKGARSTGELLMTCNTSAVAVC
jgi:GAF domain-containing protein